MQDSFDTFVCIGGFTVLFVTLKEEQLFFLLKLNKKKTVDLKKFSNLEVTTSNRPNQVK